MYGMVNQRWPAGLPRVEHGHDVRVLQPGGELDLAQEPLGAERCGELRMEHLERDRPVVLQVLGQVDGRHAAAAELAVERVAVGEGGLELRAELGLHGVPATSRWKRGLVRSGSNAGSILSHAGREVVRDLEQRLELVQRLVRLAHQDVDPRELVLVVRAPVGVLRDRRPAQPDLPSRTASSLRPA